jgi:valyl-tRNA synthetase
VTVAVEGGVFGLPIADLIDVDEEKARLEKVLAKLAKEIGGLKGRLSNPKFVESAPEEVVDETRENLRAALLSAKRKRARSAPPRRAFLRLPCRAPESEHGAHADG